MAKQNMTAWFMEEGVVAIPRNIIGLMEPLGLDFEDIGRIAYLLYCGCDNVKKSDQYSYCRKALRKRSIDGFRYKWSDYPIPIFKEHRAVQFSHVIWNR